MYKKLCMYMLIFMIFIVDTAFCADKALLVNQPAYHSMNFYVYKPANISSEFFATYDGFLVYKDSQGIWKYASAEKSGIKKTGYVVGSVIPSIVQLKPYDPKISSVAPILGSEKVPELIEIKPAGKRLPQDDAMSLELNFPVDFTQNANFMAIGKWQNSIDRIGVLEKPKTPIAWKGDYPEIIYVWNGVEWRQIPARGKHISVLSTIRRENYNLMLHTNKLNALEWTDDDSYILSQYALIWGYQWLGQLLIDKEY